MPEVPLSEHGFGLFGPAFGVPGGGFCLSAFLVLEHEGRILVGRMDPEHEGTWTERWAPNLAFYEGKRRDALFKGWRFPATYLRTGEHPDQAVQRIATEQLGLTDLDPGAPAIVSEAGASRREPQHEHWDLLFLYRATGPALADPPPAHWDELAYRSPGDLATLDLVMLHGELLELL